MSNADAIKKVSGPCVILAGAGTGKTYTIVEKVKYIIENKIYSPEKIVCITFSNEAANNLSIRIDKALENQIISEEKEKPIIRTFHGFSADLLREYGDKIGINNKFRILDPDQAKVVLHRNLRIAAGYCHKYISVIGTAKDLGIDIKEFQDYLYKKEKEFFGIDLEKKLDNLQFELQTLHLKYDSKKRKILFNEIKRVKNIAELKKFINAWRAYEKLKQKDNYQDYSDLNKNALELLIKQREIADKFTYVIVDEFQDTNKIQMDFIAALAKNKDITVVGDLNQSIYRFRGAYKENLSYFKKEFGVTDTDIFRLAKSYRSPNKVLRASHKLILNNYTNEQECFFVENFSAREGPEIEVFEVLDAKEEARKIAELIKNEQENGKLLEDICVMFRTHQQGRVIRKALDQSKIPYVAVAKASLFKQKSVKTAHDFLVIIDKLKHKKKGGEQAWWDLIYNLEFRKEDLIVIGREIKKFIKKAKDEENENKKDNLNQDSRSNETLSLFLLENFDNFKLSESGKVSSKILISKIKEMLGFGNSKLSELIKEVFRIASLINEPRTKGEREMMLNLNKFYEIAKMHEEIYDSDLDNFLYYLDILESLGIEIEASSLEEEGVRLMTSHSTKGLEFGTVIITNMAQGRFPIEKYPGERLIPTELLPDFKGEAKGMSEEEKEEFIQEYEKQNHILEERRLAYVSFTRSKEKLVLTYAQEYGNKKAFPSQFLEEIKYKENNDIIFSADLEKKYKDVEPQSSSQNIHVLLQADNFEDAVSKLSPEIAEKKKEHQRFSPSALLLFDECQKEFEFKYVFIMPERKTISWEAMHLGSFVHVVLEKGVSLGFNKVEDFLLLAREIGMEEDWESIETKDAETLIRVFFERNKGRYNQNSKTEQYLQLMLAGISFIGFADRIDFNNDGAEITDYKTGKAHVPLKNRNWQLGFYALAAQEKFGNVRKVVLDMLRQERPLEFEIDRAGNAKCISSQFIEGFNIFKIKEELIETALAIKDAYSKGFKACPIDKNCDFCNEYVYGL